MARPTREELWAIDDQLRLAGSSDLTTDAIRQSNARWRDRTDSIEADYAASERGIRPLPPQLISRATEIVLATRYRKLITRLCEVELTPSQFVAVRDRATGHTEAEVAATLGVSRRTARTHWERGCVAMRAVLSTSQEVAIAQHLIEIFGRDESNWPAVLKQMAEGGGRG